MQNAAAQHTASDFAVPPYAHPSETANEMLARLGYRREKENELHDRIVRLADGKCVIRSRGVFVTNEWAAAGCPDLDGAVFHGVQQ